KFPWENFPWERSLVPFGRVLGAVHMKNADVAKAALSDLKINHAKLVEKNNVYEATQVQVQILASEAWIRFSEGDKDEAIRLMTEAAKMEDATEKHPVTPGEVVPARELLGDLYMEVSEFAKALEAYEANLERHPGRLNGLYGAGVAAEKAGRREKAIRYFRELIRLAPLSEDSRPQVRFAVNFLKGNI
ncbi:MAG TPA: tetratricopeptide repeat protein, partial [Chryseosolibacter sp.]